MQQSKASSRLSGCTVAWHAMWQATSTLQEQIAHQLQVRREDVSGSSAASCRASAVRPDAARTLLLRGSCMPALLLLLSLPTSLFTQASDGTCWPDSTCSCFYSQGLIMLLKSACSSARNRLRLTRRHRLAAVHRHHCSSASLRCGFCSFCGVLLA
jgi:hypothetical protein